METQYLEHVQNEQIIIDKRESALIQYCDMFSSITTESFYVLDVQQKQFYYVKPDDSFICSFFAEDVLRQGYDFYTKIVYPADLCLWSDMFNAVLRYIRSTDGQWNEIDYFSCTFRLQRRYSFHPHPLPHMVFHRMKHVRKDDKLRYLICSVNSSTSKKSGNLRMYYKNGGTYDEYNFINKHWNQKKIVLLTEREKAILMLALQGKNTKEIANNLYKGQNTIRNQLKTLFSKLEVHSIQEAVEYACYHHLIFPKQDTKHQSFEVTCKRNRVILTEEILQRIQQYLDDGKSIRQAAKMEGNSESAIRYWIKKGKLELCRHP